MLNNWQNFTLHLKMQFFFLLFTSFKFVKIFLNRLKNVFDGHGATRGHWSKDDRKNAVVQLVANLKFVETNVNAPSTAEIL